MALGDLRSIIRRFKGRLASKEAFNQYPVAPQDMGATGVKRIAPFLLLSAGQTRVAHRGKCTRRDPWGAAPRARACCTIELRSVYCLLSTVYCPLSTLVAAEGRDVLCRTSASGSHRVLLHVGQADDGPAIEGRAVDGGLEEQLVPGVLARGREGLAGLHRLDHRGGHAGE